MRLDEANFKKRQNTDSMVSQCGNVIVSMKDPLHLVPQQPKYHPLSKISNSLHSTPFVPWRGAWYLLQ